MIRTLLIIACLLLPATLLAFSTYPNRIIKRKSTTAVKYHPDVFEKAVDCAQNYGMCNVDELLNLAERECCMFLCSTISSSLQLQPNNLSSTSIAINRIGGIQRMFL